MWTSPEMVKQDDLCPTCNKGTLDRTGRRYVDGFDNEPSKTKFEATQFECNNPDCRAHWTANTYNFIDKWKQAPASIN